MFQTKPLDLDIEFQCEMYDEYIDRHIDLEL